MLAANVVHVTADLALSGARLERLVAPGGSMVLYEMTAVPDFATATFGLLDGWWAFTDRRLAHAPLLDAPGWSMLLRAAGFAAVELRGIGGPTPDRYRHTVIVSRAAEAPVQPAATRVATSAPAPAVAAAATGDGLLDAICGVVAETLQMRTDQLAVDRNFSDYGADSIISVDLVREINAALGIELKTTALFNYSTVSTLAAYIQTEFGAQLGVAAEDAPKPVSRLKERSERLRGIIRKRREGMTDDAPLAPTPPAPAKAADTDDAALFDLLQRLEAKRIGVAEAMIETGK
ncbi:MAG: acyl carrier protein [Myxococcota bacterium]